MEEIKAALKLLQEAILELEAAVHVHKKNQNQNSSRIQELKDVIRNTHDRLNHVLEQVKKGEK